MAEPIHIPLSSHQVARFAQFDAETRALNARVSDTVTAIVAGHVDPATLTGWDIRLEGASILCTPPAESKPQLVADTPADTPADLGPDDARTVAAAG